MWIRDPKGPEYLRIASTRTAPEGMLAVVTDSGREILFSPEKLAAEIEAAKVPRNWKRTAQKIKNPAATERDATGPLLSVTREDESHMNNAEYSSKSVEHQAPSRRPRAP